MTDQELIAGIKSTAGESQKALLDTLWRRYENQVHKHWAILRKQMNSSCLVLELHDDFYGEAYIAFYKAIKAIKLDKIRDDKWRFVGYFKYYLTNLRGEFITKMRKQASSETPFYVETADGEVAKIELAPGVEYEQSANSPEEILGKKLEEERTQLAVQHCLQTWDARRREIFQLRQQGFAKGEVADQLGVHPATITYHLQVMKQDLEQELRRLG